MAPSIPETIINVADLEQDLQQVMSIIIRDVEKSLAATGFPMVIDGAWVASQVRENVRSGNYLVVSTSKEIATRQLENAECKLRKGLGPLNRLPRELRDLIYGFLLAAGQVAIMRASKATNQETSTLISRERTCRTNFAFAPLSPTMRPSLDMAKNIQNISIRVNTACYAFLGEPPELDILEVFSGSDVIRKSSVVTFECYYLTSPIVSYGVLRILKGFTGFQRVVLAIKMENGDPLPLNLADSQVARILGNIARAYDACEDLKPALGVGLRGVGEEKDMMIFYPGGSAEDLNYRAGAEDEEERGDSEKNQEDKREQEESEEDETDEVEDGEEYALKDILGIDLRAVP